MKIGNLNVYGIIYKITNKNNGKIYIGQSVNGFNRRYVAKGRGIKRVYGHHKRLKRNNKIYNRHLLESIEKHGFESFEVDEVIDVAFSRDELNIKEVLYIKKYDAFKNGYNQTEGGEGTVGRKKTEAEKIHLSLIKKGVSAGENNPMYGKNHSKETRRLMSKNHRFNNGARVSDETRLKISENTKNEKNPMAKKVICLTTNEIFKTMKDACKKYSLDKSTLVKCCKFKKNHNSCGKSSKNEKLIWMYYKEYIEMINENIEYDEYKKRRVCECGI